MIKFKRVNSGAILAMVLILMALLISAATVLLSTSVMNYKMKSVNSRSKKAFYNAEGALWEAYAITLDYVQLALEYASNKEDARKAYLDFLMGKCNDIENNVSLKNLLENKHNYIVYNEDNIFIVVEVVNNNDYLQLEILSKCLDKTIERRIKMVCHLLIPDDEYFNTLYPKDLIDIYDWKFEI